MPDCAHLKINDVVYISDSAGKLFRTRVESTTPAQLKTEHGHHKYRKKDGEEIGRLSEWNFNALLLPNEKIDKKYKIQELRATIRDYAWTLKDTDINKLDEFELSAVCGLLEKAIAIIKEQP